MRQRVRALAAMAVACGLVAGGAALARGLFVNPTSFGDFFYSPAPAPSPAREHRAPRKQANAFGYGQPVCVRLCDGYFFPTNSVNGGDADCAARCPDAPTELYTMTGDDINDAISSSGAPYSKLPVAKRYQTSFESTCACHSSAATAASRADELLHDATLRRGDVVMTTQGFRVYVGGGYGPTGPEDFVALSQARGLPKAERAELTAMERATSGSLARAAPALIAHRPKGQVTKGKVTVDDGAPAPRR